MRTEVHLTDDQRHWLIRTGVRATPKMRTISGSRALPSRLHQVAEWQVPASAETAKQLKETFHLRWHPTAREHRNQLMKHRRGRIGLQQESEGNTWVIPLKTETGDEATLAPFQVSGARWLINDSGILADDMGLGKTVQAVCAMNEKLAWDGSLNALVLGPVAALGVWEQHLRDWTDIEPFVFHGPRRKVRYEEYLEYEGPKALISTHGLIDKHSYRKNYGPNPKEGKPGEFNEDYDLLVLDEAHKIGIDPSRPRVRATVAVTESCEQVWCTTGTPVNDSPRDMWVLMQYIDPRVFGSYDTFAKRYCIVRPNRWDVTNFGLHLDMEPEYEWVIRPWVLRRLKETHGKDIPDALPPQVIRLQMTGPQKKAYNQMTTDQLALIDDKLVIARGRLPAQQVLQYLASCVPVIEDHKVVALNWRNSNKFQYLLEVAEDRRGDPFVVYAYSAKEVQAYAEGFRHHGFRVGVITGSSSDEARRSTVAMFQQGELAVILVTDAGGDAITLTAADLVVLTRPSWRPQANQQVMDRINRWGQTRQPMTQIVVSEDTIDETRLLSLQGKINLQEEMTLDKKRLGSLYKGRVI